jgi:hypothetical protein
MPFAPVTTLADLVSLDDTQITEGYASAECGDPEPSENRGRSFWHGWRCRMMDYRLIEADEGHRALVRAWVERNRKSSRGRS